MSTQPINRVWITVVSFILAYILIPMVMAQDDLPAPADTPVMPTPAAAPKAPKNTMDRCLTGNATGNQKNLNLTIPGRYTYYDGLTDSEFFPSAVFDNNRSAGWVSFADGTITDGKPSAVGWAGYWVGQNGIDIVFDLKGEYVISSVKIECVGRDIPKVRLSLKSVGEPRYTTLETSQSVDTNALSKPAKTVELENINASAQWVRVHLMSRNSLCEIQIWGYPLPANAKFPKKPFSGSTVVNKPEEAPFQSTDDILALPIPQEMTKTGSDFVLAPATRILYFPKESARCRTTADVLQDEIARATGLKLEIQAADSDKAPDGALLLIEPKSPPADLKPEGYVLMADKKAVVISGADPCGTFYGTQTLLQMLRKTANGWVIPGVNIRDWPECPIRMISGNRDLSENLIRGLARFKINYYAIFFKRVEKDSEFASLAEKYFVKIVLDADPRMLITKHPEFPELNPGEKVQNIGQLRINFCPSHPKLWETYFAELDKWIDKFYSDYVFIAFDEMNQYDNGSRWNSCDYCRARDMHGWELLGWTLNNLHAYFARHGKKIFMLDTCFSGHGRRSLSNKEDTDIDWRKALDLIPTNIVMGVWHPAEVNKLFADKGFQQIHWMNEPPGRGSKFPATSVEGVRYIGMCANLGDGPFSYKRFLAMPQECWSPSKAYSNDELGGLAIDKFMSQLSYILEGMRSSLEQAKPEQFFTVDLKPAANRSFIDEIPFDGKGWFDLGPNFDLRSIQPGRRELGGVPFDIIDESKNKGNGCIMLSNRGFMNPDMPDETEFAVNRKAASLIFLHAIMQEAGSGYLRRNEHAGFYFIVYDDDTYDTFDVKSGINIIPWLGSKRDASGNFIAPVPLKRGRVVWRGETSGGQAAHLAYTEWLNPLPDKTIRKVICRTAWKKSPMNIAMVAVTGVAPTGNEPKNDIQLPKAAEIAHATVNGDPIDLRDGVEKSLLCYIAPDGTTVECSKPFRRKQWKFSDVAQDFLSSAACAVYDGNHYFWPGDEGEPELTLWFPAPVFLTGFLIRCPARQERKIDDFKQQSTSWSFEFSTDGKTWKPAGKLSLREEQGPQFFPLDLGLESITALRIKDGGVVSLTPYKLK